MYKEHVAYAPFVLSALGWADSVGACPLSEWLAVALRVSLTFWRLCREESEQKL